MTILTLVLSPPSNTLAIKRRSAQGVARHRRTQELHLAEIAVGVLADPVEAAVDRQSHLPSVRLFGRNEAGRIVKPSTERMWKPFGEPSRLSAEATPR